MKRCTKCNELKSASEYYAHKRGKDGLLAYCKACAKAHVNEYAAKNRSLVSATNKVASAKFRGANREAERERLAVYREANTELCNQRVERWRKANPHKHASKENRRRAAKLNATPQFANQRYIDMFYEMARLESERLGVDVHVDHIVPLKSSLVCGLHYEHNLQLLVASANLKKSNRVWPNMP